MVRALLAGLALLLSSTAAFATKPSASPAALKPYAGAYQPVGKDEIGLWDKDDNDERILASSNELFDAPPLREYVRHV